MSAIRHASGGNEKHDKDNDAHDDKEYENNIEKQIGLSLAKSLPI